ncbi:DUF5305 domain-containing protein [Halobacteria archaeon AArc-curdl1]|uniref:DUF5305 domain-containing protein n=1 Tax=Natronosalvus hydrolyticus TaxID=2979988 RepID=A0AAP2Z7C7_9EURY|nr:DUF5305 domain-containing protein [Halobacteria archaeon AArc-curdl1]
MTETPRLDLLIAQHGRSILIALLVLGAVALLATGWVIATPGTTTVTEEIGQQTVETDVETSAEVVESGLWEEGTHLENNPAYITNATPELQVTAETTMPTDDTTVSHAIQLRYEASRDGQAFWDDNVTLEPTEAFATNQRAVTQTTIDVEAVAKRVTELEDELAGISTVDIELVVVTSYDTGTHEGTQTASTPFVLTGETYYLEEHPSSSETHPLTQTSEQTENPNSALLGALVLVALGSFGGAAVVNARSDVDVEHARQRIHEQRYAEWISQGSLPMWIGDEQVSLDTLEDVVDVAIDTNERVIQDRNRGLFAVVSDGVVYYYSDRGLWEETAWPDFDLERQSLETDSSSETTPPDDATTAPPTAEGASEQPPKLDDLPDPEDDDAWQNL